MFVVVRKPRERVTIDLRGLAPALKAHAKARHLTVSNAARLAIAAALETSRLDPEVELAGETDPAADQPVKLTIRLRRGAAARLATRARACGLSHGSYLATLIDGTPAPPLAMAAALNASNEQLAVMSTDVGEVIRLLRHDTLPSEEQLGDLVRRIVEGTRKHLDLSSRALAQLRPARTHPTRSRNDGPSQRGSR
ncbi:MAG: hypothetical protein K8R60_06005 [Burkholderiales bacterium]|nr:hypothetical protein [Burkholderiales bacterium]